MIPERAYAKLMRFFGSAQSSVQEVIQNAARAVQGQEDRRISLEILYDKTQIGIRVTDNGPGIEDLLSILVPFGSGWDDQIQQDQDPAGLGCLGALAHTDLVVWCSRGKCLRVESQRFGSAEYRATLQAVDGEYPGPGTRCTMWWNEPTRRAPVEQARLMMTRFDNIQTELWETDLKLASLSSVLVYQPTLWELLEKEQYRTIKTDQWTAYYKVRESGPGSQLIWFGHQVPLTNLHWSGGVVAESPWGKCEIDMSKVALYLRVHDLKCVGLKLPDRESISQDSRWQTLSEEVRFRILEEIVQEAQGTLEERFKVEGLAWEWPAKRQPRKSIHKFESILMEVFPYFSGYGQKAGTAPMAICSSTRPKAHKYWPVVEVVDLTSRELGSDRTTQEWSHPVDCVVSEFIVTRADKWDCEGSVTSLRTDFNFGAVPGLEDVQFAKDYTDGVKRGILVIDGQGIDQSPDCVKARILRETVVDDELDFHGIKDPGFFDHPETFMLDHLLVDRYNDSFEGTSIKYWAVPNATWDLAEALVHQKIQGLRGNGEEDDAESLKEDLETLMAKVRGADLRVIRTCLERQVGSGLARAQVVVNFEKGTLEVADTERGGTPLAAREVTCHH